MMTYDEAIKERGILMNEVNMCKHAITEAMKRKNYLVKQLKSISGYIDILEREQKEVTNVPNEA